MGFELFDKLHIFYLIGYSLIFIFLYFGVSYSPRPRKIMGIISFVILLIKCGELFIKYKFLQEPWYQLLPLHLCNIALIFAVIGTIFNFLPFLAAEFFWSIGAVSALLTPEVRDTFPHFFNISFFSTHFYIIFTAIVNYKVFKFRPTFSSWLGSLIGINIIMACVFYINNILGTNYLYINKKPSFSSPLDYFGEWPYYVIVLEVIYIVLTLLMFLLFKSNKNKVKISR